MLTTKQKTSILPPWTSWKLSKGNFKALSARVESLSELVDMHWVSEFLPGLGMSSNVKIGLRIVHCGNIGCLRNQWQKHSTLCQTKFNVFWQLDHVGIFAFLLQKKERAIQFAAGKLHSPWNGLWWKLWRGVGEKERQATLETFQQLTRLICSRDKSHQAVLTMPRVFADAITSDRPMCHCWEKRQTHTAQESCLATS